MESAQRGISEVYSRLIEYSLFVPRESNASGVCRMAFHAALWILDLRLSGTAVRRVQHSFWKHSPTPSQWSLSIADTWNYRKWQNLRTSLIHISWKLERCHELSLHPRIPQVERTVSREHSRRLTSRTRSKGPKEYTCCSERQGAASPHKRLGFTFPNKGGSRKAKWGLECTGALSWKPLSVPRGRYPAD